MAQERVAAFAGIYEWPKRVDESVSSVVRAPLCFFAQDDVVPALLE